MDSTVQSSFIPKEAALTKHIEKSGGEPISMFMVIALVLLAVSVLFFAGVYGYRVILAQEINKPCVSIDDAGNQSCGLAASVDKEKRALDPDRLNKYRRLDAKMKIAADIINKHNTFLPFFNVLASSTLKTIRYNSFEYNEKNGFSLSGIAQGYEDIAVQSKVFGAIKQIKSFMFSDLNLDNQGNVTFKLVLTIDPTLVSYKLYTDSLMPAREETVPETSNAERGIIYSISTSSNNTVDNQPVSTTTP